MGKGKTKFLTYIYKQTEISRTNIAKIYRQHTLMHQSITAVCIRFLQATPGYACSFWLDGMDFVQKIFTPRTWLLNRNKFLQNKRGLSFQLSDFGKEQNHLKRQVN